MSRFALLLGVLCLPVGLLAAESLDKELGFVSAEKSTLGGNTVERGKVDKLPALWIRRTDKADDPGLFVVRTHKPAKDRKQAEEDCSKLGKGAQWRLPNVLELLVAIEASGGKKDYLPDLIEVTNDDKLTYQIVSWVDFAGLGGDLREDSLLAFSGLNDMQPLPRTAVIEIIENMLVQVRDSRATDFAAQIDVALLEARRSREAHVELYTATIQDTEDPAAKKKLQEELDALLKQLDDRIDKLRSKDKSILAEFERKTALAEMEMKKAIALLKEGPTVLCVAGKIELPK